MLRRKVISKGEPEIVRHPARHWMTGGSCHRVGFHWVKGQNISDP
jgi:hypothetical protein